jgi:hypothetical protein
LALKFAKHYEFDEVGIDLGLHKTGSLWLFEVNTNDAMGSPSHELFANLPDKRIYEQMKHREEDRKNEPIKFLF